MKRIVLLGLAAAAGAFVGTVALAQHQHEPAATTQAYVPPLADLMLLVQSRHAKLWLAGRAANWELANFAIHEIEDNLANVAKLYPTLKDIPIGPMIESSVKEPIAEIEKAIKARSRTAFTRAYDKLTVACNTCHRSTNHGFIVIQRPAGSPFPNQSFLPTGKE
jgi:hypothetical protein